MSIGKVDCLIEQLKKRVPALADDVIHDLAWDAYNQMSFDPENYTLAEIIDARTFEKKLVWVEKH